MPTHGIITTQEPYHHHACEMSREAFDLAVKYKLTEQGTATTLRQNTEITLRGHLPKIMVAILYPMVIWMSKKQYRVRLKNLKALCEQKAE